VDPWLDRCNRPYRSLSTLTHSRFHIPQPHTLTATVASAASQSSSVTDPIFPWPRPQESLHDKTMEYSKVMTQVLEREGLPLQNEKDLDPLIEVGCPGMHNVYVS
jgi:hypothetical protein